MCKVRFLGYDCEVTFGKYRNNDRVVIELIDIQDGEAVVTASINLPNESIAKNEVAIKNYSENEGILNVLIQAKIISTPKRFVSTGFVSIPICEFLVEPKF